MLKNDPICYDHFRTTSVHDGALQLADLQTNSKGTLKRLLVLIIEDSDSVGFGPQSPLSPSNMATVLGPIEVLDIVKFPLPSRHGK